MAADGRWWEIVEMLRKLFITAIAVYIYPGSASQIAVSLLVMMAYLALVLLLRPYRSASDSWVAATAHFELSFILIAALVSSISSKAEKLLFKCNMLYFF